MDYIHFADLPPVTGNSQIVPQGSVAATNRGRRGDATLVLESRKAAVRNIAKLRSDHDPRLYLPRRAVLASVRQLHAVSRVIFQPFGFRLLRPARLDKRPGDHRERQHPYLRSHLSGAASFFRDRNVEAGSRLQSRAMRGAAST